MSNNKYYTPKLSEFCDGFEFERFVITSEKWVKEVFKIGEENYYFISKRFVKDLQNGDIRVKHLDQEDIESLGFVFVKAFIHTPQTKYWGKDFTLWADFEAGNFELVNKEGITKYHGKIRNKFHLSQILNDIM